jgi:hypothetical protein
VKVDRRAGFTNAVELSVEGVPTGVNLTLDKIPGGAAETTLKLIATEKAPPGTNTLTILGAGMHNDRNYKHKSGGITLVISAPEATEPPAAATASTTTQPVGAK